MDVMTGFMRTEVGVIPEDWNVIAVEKVCDLVVDCKNRTPPVVDGGDYAVVRTPNVRNGKFVRNELRYTNEASFQEWTARAVPKIGDIFITREAPLGEVCLMPPDVPVCLGQRMMLYRPNQNRADSHFLLYALMSAGVQNNLLRMIGGSTVGHAKVDDIRNLLIPVPPTKSEQEAIAEALSDADALIESLERIIAKKRQIKQGAMQEVLTPNENWEVKKLESLADVIDPHPSHRAPPKTSNGIPFVGIGDLDESGNIVGTKVRLVSASVFREHLTRYDLEDGLIGLGRVASIGKVVKLKPADERYVVSPTLGVIRSKLATREFLLYALRSRFITDQFDRIVSGSTRSSVGMIVLRQLNIALPRTRSEQTTIAEILSDMDAEIAALDAKLNKARQVKQGMMQELLTGRIRLV